MFFAIFGFFAFYFLLWLFLPRVTLPFLVIGYYIATENELIHHIPDPVIGMGFCVCFFGGLIIDLGLNWCIFKKEE